MGRMWTGSAPTPIRRARAARRWRRSAPGCSGRASWRSSPAARRRWSYGPRSVAPARRGRSAGQRSLRLSVHLPGEELVLVARALSRAKRRVRPVARHTSTVGHMAVLSNEEVDAALPGLAGWERADNSLRRSVKFPSFLDGIDAVRRVADRAEAADHHPDIDIRSRTVTFVLSTHSQGGITQNDLALAREIDEIVGQ